MNDYPRTDPAMAGQVLSAALRRKTVSVILVLCCSELFAAQARPLDPKSEVAPFVAEIVAAHGLERRAVEKILADAKVLDQVLKAMSRPAERMQWKKYRPIFMTKERIRRGVEFATKHLALLKRAEDERGVPWQVITAIIGVETFYGRITGKYRVLDSLATLGFRHARRGKFFKRELSHFLALAHAENLDPLMIKGSYAGAMGIPQFIPSSYLEYAVDFDGDGRRDLIGSTADAIGSVASYLARHGWKRGEVVAYQVDKPVADMNLLVTDGLKPDIRAEQLREAGVEVPVQVSGKRKVAVYSLHGAGGKEYWVGLRNFYAITRYNRSKLYALAVHQLAQAINAELPGK